jgi:uncharacterized protein
MKRSRVYLSGGGFGNSIELIAEANLSNPQSDQITLLEWNGESTLKGPLSKLGKKMIDVRLKNIIEALFIRINQRLHQRLQT